MGETIDRASVIGFSRRHLLESSAALLVMSGFASPSAAQESQARAAAEAPTDIIVTASRREELLSNVPISTSVILNDTTLASGIVDINAIADLVPGLKATDGGSPNLGNLTIRGVFTGGSPTVGTYLDDVPYGPVVGGAGTSLAFDGSMFDLDRIEVNRGPQGTLFGAGAMGGVVRYITRAPDLEAFSGYGFGDVSFTKNGETNYILRGRLSAPIVRDKIAVSVSGFYSKAGGYIDHPLRDATNVDGSEFWGGMVSVIAKPTERLTIRGTAVHQEASFENASYVGFNPSIGETILGDLTDITQVASPRTVNFDLYYGTVDYEFDFATLTSVSSWQSLEFVTLSDITSSFGPIADFFAPAGAPHTAALFAPFDTRRFSQEVRLTSTTNGKFEWIIGGYYTNQRTDQIQLVITDPADVNLIDVSSPLRYREYAAFGNATYYISPDWDVTAGIRYSDVKTSVLQNVDGLLVPPSFNAPSNEFSDSVTTFLFNTRYRVSSEINLYARAASGYRPGGSNLVTRDADGNPLGQPAFNADKLWTYEVGAKGSALQGALTYSVAAYYLTWSDAQVSVVLENGLGGTSNALGDIHGTGIEASFTGRPLAGLEVTANLAFTDTELQRDEPNIGARKGSRLPDTPDVTASVLADYRFALGSTVDANIGATWRYTGSYLTPYSAALPPFREGEYSQFDARAGVSFGDISVTAYVTNIFDSRAYQTVFPVSPAYAQGVVLRPRTIGINARMNF